jgi:PleD family two-component response regulator
MDSPLVLLVDRKSPTLLRWTRALEHAGLLVCTAHNREGAEAAILHRVPDVLIYSNALPGESKFALCRHLKERDSSSACVVLASRPDPKLNARAQAAGVDQLLGRPLSAKELSSTARAMVQVRALRQRLEAVARLPSAKQVEGIDVVTGFSTFERFKQTLFIEVKRARRYGFPVALLLASIEAEPPLDSPEVRVQLSGGLAVAVRGVTRDTDQAVSYGKGQVLVLMPHTDLKGANTVARRLLFRVAGSSFDVGSVKITPKVSIGFSASGQGSPLVFSEMVKQAAQSLTLARERGGNCVVPSAAA